MAVIERRKFVVTCDLCKKTAQVETDIRIEFDADSLVEPLRASTIIPKFWALVRYRHTGKKDIVCRACIDSGKVKNV